MIKEVSVVTPERFAQGLTYADYLGRVKVNRDKFDQYYNNFQVATDAAEALRRLAQHPKGPAKMLILGEEWCPDVFRGMPTAVRMAEVVGMEVRVFPSDSNLDIMGEFLNKGKFMSLPALVFYTWDHQYICHWIERPESVTKEQAEIRECVEREMADADDLEKGRVRRERINHRVPVYQRLTVDDIIALLQQHVV
jgi:hypothetical protein